MGRRERAPVLSTSKQATGKRRGKCNCNKDRSGRAEREAVLEALIVSFGVNTYFFASRVDDPYQCLQKASKLRKNIR